MYRDNLITSEKKYYLGDGKIFSIEIGDFGNTITKIYFESESLDQLQKIWTELYNLYNMGKRDKLEEIKKVLEIR